MNIDAINANLRTSGTYAPFSSNETKTSSSSSVAEGFTEVLGDVIGQVNELQQQANTDVEKLATGESKGLHEVMISMEKASISFQFLTQMRNKAVEAYQEIMKMQV